MSFIQWAQRGFKKGRIEVRPVTVRKPLREFVYLDEVSLRSLLSSQKGEVTEGKSEQVVDAYQAELGGTAGVNAPLVGKSELTSRFQTSNSSTIQTSRKSTVQSWFGEFLSIPKIRLVEAINGANKVADTEELTSISDTSVVVKSSELVRGALVEFRVKLAADPVFRLGTMVSEFTGMAEDYPEMFAADNALNSLKETQPINKILQRLLAGLIPVRAEAIDYKVIKIDGIEYVVHRDALSGLELEEKPLEIVGVTEHLAYWKDIRRVLFSDAEFTVLGRVARSSLQPAWTPVKLVDLFSELTPDLVEKISAASLVPFNGTHTSKNQNSNELSLDNALRLYKDALLEKTGKRLTEDQEVRVNSEIVRLQPRVSSASGQRSAFLAVGELLSVLVGARIDSAIDFQLREDARGSSGLPLFPSISREAPSEKAGIQIEYNQIDPRLLDVEIVAIYW